MVPRFVEFDRSIARDQLPRLDRAGAGLAAVRAGLGLLSGLRLRRAEVLTQRPGHPLTGFVGASFEGGEVQFVGGRGIPQHVRGKQRHKLLKPGVLGTIAC